MTAAGWIPAPVPDADPGFAGMTKLPVLYSYAKVSSHIPALPAGSFTLRGE